MFIIAICLHLLSTLSLLLHLNHQYKIMLNKKTYFVFAFSTKQEWIQSIATGNKNNRLLVDLSL